MKNLETYSEEIRIAYERKKESGALSSDLYKLTPGSIRKEFLSYDLKGLSNNDKGILENFFGKDNDDIRMSINKFDLELLKPLCTFLKRNSQSLQILASLELIALLIDFKPRPYREYRIYNEKERSKITINQFKKQDDGTSTEGADLIPSSDIRVEEEDNSTVVRPGVKPKYKPQSKTILRALWIIAILGLGWTSYTLFKSEDKNECMVWVKDHYEVIVCSGAKFEKKLDKETQEGMSQLIGLCKNSTFFLPNGEPVVWYDKYHNKLTFFTMPGIHPTNGRTLKVITQHIVETNVEDCEVAERE